MKSLKLAVVAISLIGVFGVGNVMALGEATINVSATVLGTCAFDTNAYNMQFGVIDPLTDTGDKTATVNLAFTCSNGTVWSLTDATGTKTMTGDVTSDTLNYSIDDYFTANATGTGTGATQNVLITGRIADDSITGYLSADADVYRHSFTIDITP